MNLSFFDQFSRPHLHSIPLILLSLLFPALYSRHQVTNESTTDCPPSNVTPTPNYKTTDNPTKQKWAQMSPNTDITNNHTSHNLPSTTPPHTRSPQLPNYPLALPWPSPFDSPPCWQGYETSHQPPSPTYYPEGTPTPLIPALILIETTSLLIRPLALGVRLTANLTAGHLLIQLISTASVALAPTLPAVSALTAIILLLLTILEVAVAMIQAYVFVLLLSLYLQENI
uniref:ATP synthase subunit a n=1 Tax=Mergus squamatus TaxID=670348 RepID=H6TBM1_9AVES|nr:ATP synthase F0 subunit 6 [Mergus squamatus]ADX36097.1 ATP synthase F0 subunit 6 [Mergus squamatus]